jgi:hypothetical protein
MRCICIFQSVARALGEKKPNNREKGQQCMHRGAKKLPWPWQTNLYLLTSGPYNRIKIGGLEMICGGLAGGPGTAALRWKGSAGGSGSPSTKHLQPPDIGPCGRPSAAMRCSLPPCITPCCPVRNYICEGETHSIGQSQNYAGN